MANEWRFFSKIPQAVKRYARTEFGRTPIGQALQAASAAQAAMGGRGARRALGIPELPKLQEAVSGGNLPGVIQLLRNRDVGQTMHLLEKYARQGDSQFGLLQQLLSSLGPVGRALSSLTGGGPQGGQGFGRQMRTALNLVSSFADDPHVLGALQRILEGAGAQVTWPGGQRTTVKEPKILPGQPPPAGTRGKSKQELGDLSRTTVQFEDGGRQRRLKADHPVITGAFVETPESSNVHSFAFDLDTHSLYVKFKEWHPGMTGPRPQAPGAIYRYSNVPLELFERMLKADSKGTFIWDNIRIRGTISGHHFDYQLVGVQASYVPRKATLTPRGEEYVSRSVFSDRGRQLKSALPQRLVRPLVSPGRLPRSGK